MEEVCDVLGTTRTAALVAFLLALLALQMAGRAQPSIRVRGESHIDLEVAEEPTGWWARARLVDEAGRALARRTAVLRVEEGPGEPIVPRAVLSDENGEAAFDITPLAASGRRVEVSFAGDDWYEPSHARVMLDGRSRVKLAFIAPASEVVDLSAPGHLVAVHARPSSVGAGLPVAIYDERGRELATGITSGSGVLRIEIASSTLGPAGEGELVAVTAGDDSRSPARASAKIVRHEPTQLELAAREQAFRHGTALLSGRLTARGLGVANVAVGLFRGEQHLATVLTDESGRFEHTLRADRSAARGDAHRVQARFESASLARGSSRSRVVEVAFTSAPRLQLAWLLAPPLACAVALALWRARSRARLHDTRAAAPEPRVGPGVALASARTRLGFAALRHVKGRVLDAETHRPVQSARIELTCDARSVVTDTDRDGRFELHATGDGTHTLAVRADGFRKVEALARVPHRGEWSHAVVRIESLRSAAARAFVRPALHVDPGAHHWASRSPREMLQRVAGMLGDDQPAAASLLERAELAAYGREAPSEPEVDAIERDAARLHDSLERSPDPSRG